jgi:glycosyltransferase involved in cell wall biosynthesis
MRVLALTKYDRHAASTRQRLLQFLPFLEEHGIEVVAHPLFDGQYVRNLAKGQPTGWLTILHLYVKRFLSLHRISKYDLVWIHFEAFPYLPGIFERLITLFGRPIIVDFDDAIYHQYDRHSRSLVRVMLGKKLVPLLSKAAGVTVGNAYVGDYIARYNDAVTIIPTVVDTSLYSPTLDKPENRIVIGWIGSPSTWRYVENVLPELLPLLAKSGAVFRAIGAGPAAARWSEIECFEWSEETEIAAVQSMDIGIMPLPDEEWARGKCGYKLIQYMACGLPTVASPVGVNSEIVVDGKTGYLAYDIADWLRALERLITNRELRARFGAAGRARAVERYSLQSQQSRILAAFHAAVEHRR